MLKCIFYNFWFLKIQFTQILMVRPLIILNVAKFFDNNHL